jgi:hypothetical protein
MKLFCVTSQLYEGMLSVIRSYQESILIWGGHNSLSSFWCWEISSVLSKEAGSLLFISCTWPLLKYIQNCSCLIMITRNHLALWLWHVCFQRTCQASPPIFAVHWQIGICYSTLLNDVLVYEESQIVTACTVAG